MLVVLNTGAAATPFDAEWGRALVRHPALPAGAVVTLRWGADG